MVIFARQNRDVKMSSAQAISFGIRVFTRGLFVQLFDKSQAVVAASALVLQRGRTEKSMTRLHSGQTRTRKDPSPV